MRAGRFAVLLAAVLVLAAPAQVRAQSLITPDAFLDLAQGRTLTFVDVATGRVVGDEQFLSRTLSVWRFSGDVCIYGQISVRGSQLCFLYDDAPDRGPVCWFPYRDGDRLFVRLASLFDRETQEVTRISEAPLNCPDPPIS